MILRPGELAGLATKIFSLLPMGMEGGFATLLAGVGVEGAGAAAAAAAGFGGLRSSESLISTSLTVRRHSTTICCQIVGCGLRSTSVKMDFRRSARFSEMKRSSQKAIGFVNGACVERRPVTSEPLGSLDLSVTTLPFLNGSSRKKEIKAVWAISVERQIIIARTALRMNNPGPTGNAGSTAERFNQ
jgi:hypothetical protein